MEFFDLIQKRRSTRKFLSKPVEEEKLQKILEAANLAPSAHNSQSYKIYLIKNQELKDKLTKAALDQEFISQASVVLVFVAIPKWTAFDAERCQFYALQDATIACYQSWLAVVDLGLSAVWVGAFNGLEVVKILNLKGKEKPVAILPIGYAGESPEKKKRKSLSEIIVNC